MSEWFNSITHAIGKIKVNSAVDSLGKIMMLSLLVFLGASVFVDEMWVLIFLACFLVFLSIIFACSYVYCLIKNPDLLRSEEYNIKKQVVEKLGDKDNYQLIDSKHLASFANPNPYLGGYLERKEGGDE